MFRFSSMWAMLSPTDTPLTSLGPVTRESLRSLLSTELESSFWIMEPDSGSLCPSFCSPLKEENVGGSWAGARNIVRAGTGGGGCWRPEVRFGCEGSLRSGPGSLSWKLTFLSRALVLRARSQSMVERSYSSKFCWIFGPKVIKQTNGLYGTSEHLY